MTARGALKHGGLRVLVTGGRDYDDRQHVFCSLDRVARKHGVVCLISGHCMKFDPDTGEYVPCGADALAEEWADANRVPVMPYPVTRSEWRTLGKSAGPLRNRRMVNEAVPDVCVKFPGGSGTNDCASYAHERGILVWDTITNEVF